jgi:hypothetical protein
MRWTNATDVSKSWNEAGSLLKPFETDVNSVLNTERQYNIAVDWEMDPDISQPHLTSR